MKTVFCNSYPFQKPIWSEVLLIPTLFISILSCHPIFSLSDPNYYLPCLVHTATSLFLPCYGSLFLFARANIIIHYLHIPSFIGSALPVCFEFFDMKDLSSFFHVLKYLWTFPDALSVILSLKKNYSEEYAALLYLALSCLHEDMHRSHHGKPVERCVC